MLDADYGARPTVSSLLLCLSLLRVADEVVEYTCEIARASADVEYTRAGATGGTVAQIREEELGCVRVLFCESLERMFS